jgi:hypothetical protein
LNKIKNQTLTINAKKTIIYAKLDDKEIKLKRLKEEPYISGNFSPERIKQLNINYEFKLNPFQIKSLLKEFSSEGFTHVRFFLEASSKKLFIEGAELTEKVRKNDKIEIIKTGEKKLINVIDYNIPDPILECWFVIENLIKFFSDETNNNTCVLFKDTSEIITLRLGNEIPMHCSVKENIFIEFLLAPAEIDDDEEEGFEYDDEDFEDFDDLNIRNRSLLDFIN